VQVAGALSRTPPARGFRAATDCGVLKFYRMVIYTGIVADAMTYNVAGRAINDMCVGFFA
jgi:hypothetical protein